MSNRSATYTLNLNSNVVQALRAHEEQALRLDNVMNSLNNTMRAFGLGFAGAAIINSAKEWTQGAADYETAMLRIKNSSENAFEAASNQAFITHEVEKFKIPLQSATEDYGKFLAMISGSGMASEKVRELHDNFLMINKIQGLSNSEISRSIYDLGVLLTESRPDAMHLKGLTVNLHGYKHFLAQALGEGDDYIGEIIHKKMTGAIPKQAFIDAIALMAEAKKGGLPDALQTMQSQINELDNRWTMFKNNIVMSVKPELISLFKELENGVHWLKEHEKGLIEAGKIVLKITEYWLGYKLAVGSVRLAVAGYRSIAALFITETVTQTSAYQAQALAINEVTAAIERLNFVQNATNASFLATEAGIVANTAGNRFAATAGQSTAGAAATGAAASKMGLGGMIMYGAAAAATAVIIVDILGNAAQKMGLLGGKTTTGMDFGFNEGFYGRMGFGNYAGSSRESIDALFPNGFKADRLKEVMDIINSSTNKKGGIDFRIDKNRNFTDDQNKEVSRIHVGEESVRKLYWAAQYFGDLTKVQFNGKQNVDLPEAIEKALNPSSFRKGGYFDQHIFTEDEKNMLREFAKSSSSFAEQMSRMGYVASGGKGMNFLQWLNLGQEEGKDGKGKIDKSGLPDPTKDKNKIRGNSVTNIHIEIHEMNGIKQATVKVAGDLDIEKITTEVGNLMTKRLTDTVNDSQLVGQHH